MKPLYDQNLPPSLVASLSDILPAGEHVRNLGMSSSSDSDIWNYAKENDYAIVSKDSDFQSMALLNGHPPKSVRVRVGNSSVVEIETFIRSRIERILEFDANQYEAHLNLT